MDRDALDVCMSVRTIAEESGQTFDEVLYLTMLFWREEIIKWHYKHESAFEHAMQMEGAVMHIVNIADIPFEDALDQMLVMMKAMTLQTQMEYESTLQVMQERVDSIF